MKKIVMIIWIIFILWIIIWIAWSYFIIKSLEEPKFTIIEEKKWYQIRQYESYIVAEVEVNGNQNEALNQWFWYLAWYIFGWNNENDSIAMTVPVAETKKTWTQIAMTVPVSNTIWNNDTRIVQFSMPSKYTIETLPKPNNDKVILKTLPWYKAAILTYSWFTTEKKVENMKNKLLSLLELDNQEIIWEITSAQYNPPLSFPLLRRNEIIIPIK